MLFVLGFSEPLSLQSTFSVYLVTPFTPLLVVTLNIPEEVRHTAAIH